MILEYFFTVFIVAPRWTHKMIRILYTPPASFSTDVAICGCHWQPQIATSVLTVSYACISLSASPLWSWSRYWNRSVPTSFLLSLEQKSTGSTTTIKTYCWWRSCYQRSAALLETCLSSSKTMHQHIATFWISQGKWLQLTSKVGTFIRFWCQIFSGSRNQKSLKLVNHRQSYSKNKKMDSFFGHTVYIHNRINNTSQNCMERDFENSPITFWVILLTNKRTDKQME